MAGGANAAIVPCLKCAGPAHRTYEGQEDDHYRCSECGLEFGIDWSSDGPPQTPRWPILKKKQKRYERWQSYFHLESDDRSTRAV